MKRNCCTCLVALEDENAPILTMGAYGNPKCLCPECAELVEKITEGKDYDSITESMELMTKRMSKANIDDRATVSAMTDLLANSAERAQKIKDGTYDFAEDNEPAEGDEEAFEEIPEELRETEEDRLLDEQDAEAMKKFDKILNWMWVGVGVVAAVLVVLKIIEFFS